MFRDEKLEFKVGIFIGIGIFLMFLIVFSIGDLYPFQKGYSVDVVFDYINGLTKDAPVRLAGVNVGEVKKIDLFYDEEIRKTRVNLNIRIRSDIQIEEDSMANINTLGLLGEQYLEISPGTVERFLKPGDVLVGQNPLRVGEQMIEISKLVKSISKIADSIEKGTGTVGKLIMEDDLYNEIEGFVKEIRANPWKLLHKPSKSERRALDKKKRGAEVDTR